MLELVMVIESLNACLRLHAADRPQSQKTKRAYLVFGMVLLCVPMLTRAGNSFAAHPLLVCPKPGVVLQCK